MRPLVWFRRDLRLADNPALHEACKTESRGVVAVFLMCPKQWKRHDLSDVRIDFVLRSLGELSRALAKKNIALLIREASLYDDVPDALLAVAREHGCDSLFFNEAYEVNERARDDAASEVFRESGHTVSPSAISACLRREQFEPATTTFTVSSPVQEELARATARRRIARGALRSAQAIRHGRGRRDDVPESVSGFDATTIDPDFWPAGEPAATKQLKSFAASTMSEYDEVRDNPMADATSRLSPYLAIGNISVRTCVHSALEHGATLMASDKSGPSVWLMNSAGATSTGTF